MENCACSKFEKKMHQENKLGNSKIDMIEDKPITQVKWFTDFRPQEEREQELTDFCSKALEKDGVLLLSYHKIVINIYFMLIYINYRMSDNISLS